MDNTQINPLQIVPEFIIRQSAEIFKNDANNMFAQMLCASDEFKNAGMTPVFLYNENTNHLQLVTVETYGKRLH